MHVANGVQASEKIYQSFTLEVTNPGGHSSLPVKDNAIYRLADALIRIRAYDFPVALNEVTRIFFERSAELEEGELAAAMRGILNDPPDPAAAAYLSRTPFYNSRLRTTCVATLLDGGHAENALPQRAQATVNCRVLPGESVDIVQDTLRTVIGDEAVTITPVQEALISPPSPLTPELLSVIEGVTEEMWPGVPVVPMMSTGATDGLFLRSAGMPVYGVSGVGGGGTIKNGVHVANGVQASEKIYQSFTLEVTNPGGHSSLPVKDNAIYRLADALIRIRAYDFPVALNEVTRIFFERSAELEEGELAAAMRGILNDPPDPAAAAYLSRTPFYNSRLRTTCVATLLDGGHAENALPQRAQATVNCRVLPGESVDIVQDTLRTVIGDEAVTITPVQEALISPPSPLTPELLSVIEGVTEEMWPGVPVVPMMSTGATDGLFLRSAGMPVYGVSGLFSDIADNRAHGQNERILIKSYFEGQEFLYRLMTRLSRSDKE